MQRRELPLALLAASSTSAVWAASAPSHSASSSQTQATSAEQQARIAPKAIQFGEGDIRRYGASTAASDNSPALDNALLVSANGGNPAFIPPGVWKTARPASATQSCSMYGAGQASTIAPQGCDGLVFSEQPNYAGARFFRDFSIIGTATSGKRGIVVDRSAASGHRITGIQFSNLHIQKFGVAVFLRGLWNSSFRDCFLYQNFCGYHFHGQNILNSIDAGFVQLGDAAGSGDTFGILVDSVDGESTQSLHMNGAGIYGYRVNVCLALALYTTIQDCDISVCTSIGVQIVTVQGGTTVRDCWIQTNGAGRTIGVQLAARATPAPDKIVIDGCALECNLAHPESVGIEIGSNQTGVTTNNNTVGAAAARFATGIRNTGARNHVAKFNAIHASGNAIEIAAASIDCEIGPNAVHSGIPLVAVPAAPAGLSYFGRGSFALTLSGVECSCHGDVAWAASGRTVQLLVGKSGISGSSNANSLSASGLPAVLVPTIEQSVPVQIIDNGAVVSGRAVIGPSALIAFAREGGETGFGRSGTKGLPAGALITYSLP